MFKNYLKIGLRNLFKNKAFSLINITGLAVGMASAILILLWIANEVSYDRFHKNDERIYEVYNRAIFNGKLESWAITARPLGPQLKNNYPEIEETARTYDANFLFSVGDKHLNAHGNYTDPGFLKIFDFPLVYGNVNTAFTDPHSIIITQKLAKKLFGTDDAMGKVIRLDSAEHFTVTGVLKDLPNNTRFWFEYLMPWSYLDQVEKDNNSWSINSVFTYALLKPGVTQEAADAKIKNTIKEQTVGEKAEVFLHPVSKWRLYSKFENGLPAGGRIEVVKLFSVIAGFILLIACINFMNLSTARSEKRSKEVGIRKVSGAMRTSLIAQFLIESIIIVLCAAVLALCIVSISMPAFNQLTDKQLSVPYSSLTFWMISIGFILFTGLLAGSYPAFFLSSFKPVKVLKGVFKAGSAQVTPRKVLVVFQFAFAVVLIICTIIVQKQIDFAKSRDTGYNNHNLMYMRMVGNMEKNYAALKQELISSGVATSVTKTSSPMTESWSSSNAFEWDGKAPKEVIEFKVFNTDEDFAKTVGVKVISGRGIDVNVYPSDTSAILLNETAVKAMNFKNPIGQIVRATEGGKPSSSYHVVGVVNDFILESPYSAISPMMLQGTKNWYNIVNYKLNPAISTATALKKAADIFKKINPDYPFEYSFTDTEYQQKFYDEQRTRTLARLFAGLTIIISCLGLFGLSAYMAENRIKEIGVRKVLGASAASIATLLSKDFLKLVAIAFIVASPIAWYAMNKWLQSYSYRINIGLWVFVLAGGVTIFIAIATVSYQAVKAALSNPVKSLRSE